MNEPAILDKQLSAHIEKLNLTQKEQVLAFIQFLEYRDENLAVSSSDDNMFINFDIERAKELKKKAKPLEPGFLKGTFNMKSDFDEPLDDFKEYME